MYCFLVLYFCIISFVFFDLPMTKVKVEMPEGILKNYYEFYNFDSLLDAPHDAFRMTDTHAMESCSVMLFKPSVALNK